MHKSRFLLCLSTAAITLSVFIFTAACHKKAETTAEDTGYAADQATTEQTFNDVQSIADQASALPTGTKMAYRTSGGSSPCATITRTTTAVGGTITIDFGTTDCTGNDGRKRRGQILVSYTGNYADAGSTHTITFNNFFQNDNKVTGTKTVTNMGANAVGQPWFNVTVNGAVTPQSGSGTISTSWTRLRTWTAGYDTPNDFTDDVYQITGSGTMVRANGMNVGISIPSATPLVVAASCRWIEAGSVLYNLPGNLTRTLNYGNTPACDDEAQLTLANGKIENIMLP